MTSELETITRWLQSRPNNAAIFATDTGFMAQTLEYGDNVREVEAPTIIEAIQAYEKQYGKSEEKR